MSSQNPGTVFVKEYIDDDEIPIHLLKRHCIFDYAKLPTVTEPKGLDASRQWNLFQEIRLLCISETNKDVTCPKHAVPKTDLLIAAESGDLKAVERSLENGANVNCKDNIGDTPLHDAASGGFVDVASLLISKGADIHSQDYDGDTPLHKASERGFVDVASLLISKGADIHSQDYEGDTPLHKAAMGGFVDVAELLISKGADINSQNQWGYTPLHYAARGGFVDVASLLISKGADIHSQDNEKNTPLHWAARGGFVDVAELLISKGADIQSEGQWKETPLHKASERGFVDVASLLISKGADIHSQNILGRTALDVADEKAKILLQRYTKDKKLSTDKIMMKPRLDKKPDTPQKPHKLTTQTPFKIVGKSRFFRRRVQDNMKAGLPRELLHLGKHDAIVFTDLLKEESYELFELRSMLQGEQGTGKSTIARFLVGKGPTKFRRSTDGIDLYTGLASFDNDTEEWISGKHVLKMEDIILSRSVKSYQHQRTPVNQSGQTNKDIASKMPSEISKEISEAQEPVTMLQEETHTEVLQKQVLGHQSQKEDIEISATERVQEMLPKDIPRKMLEPQLLSLQEWQLKKLEIDSSLVSVDTSLEMYQLGKVKSVLSEDKEKEIFEMTVNTMPKEEAILKKQDLIYHSEDEELALSTDIPLSKQESTEKQDLVHHSIGEEFLSDIIKIDGKEIPVKPVDHTDFEIIKNPGIIGKLKTFFGVQKDVKEVKISVTKKTFFSKSRNVAKKEFHKRNVVPVTIWDFGGQDVFYSTHQTFLTYRAVYMLVLDGSRALNEPCKYEQFLPGREEAKTQKDYVRFWINTIITYCKGDIPGFPKIMVILTHKDKLKVNEIDARRNEIFSEIERMFVGSPIEQHMVIKDRIFVNARNSEDPEMEQIKKSLIHQARIQPTWGQKLPKCFLPLELEIQNLATRGVTLIHIEQMKKINSQQPIRPLTESELKVFLKFQHAVGKILYFDEPFLDKHIIISPTYLIDAFKSIITDHQFCKGDKKKEEAWHSMAKTGMIFKQTVEKIWKQKKYAHFYKSMKYLLGVMTYLDILVEPFRYDSAHNRKPNEFYYVASMIRKQDTTRYLQHPTFSQRNIAFCFDTSGFIIPPALSFRFISYCLSIWGVKTYGNDNEDMLFHRSAVFTIDPSLDIHIQCEEEQLIVRLVHARNRTLIMKDLASSIRECLSAALHKISQLYIKTSSERTESIQSFDVRACCSSSTQPCSIAFQDIGNVWICPQHQIEHVRDLVVSWLTEKGSVKCESVCPVENEQFLQQSPSELHLRRLAVEYDLDEVKKLVIQLKLPIGIWNELYRSALKAETIKFTALYKCLNRMPLTFKDIKIAAGKQDIQTPHTLCKVLRDRHITFASDPEKWDLIPSDKDIDKLAPVVGDNSLSFLVELGLTFQDWEQIEYSQTERDLVKLNRKIMEAWRTNCKVHNIKPTLRTIGQAFENIGICTKNIENTLFTDLDY